ncbi:hypothetical protein [Rhodoblastus sp.]|uniref:hypothetical protein n=1 Tax=Rhodoblastus sp. TaxID=1962975 RepID=UPI003F975D7F
MPVAILPNLSGGKAIEAEIVALTPTDDPRVQAMRTAIPLFAELLSRFTNAFGVPLEPFVFIARSDAVAKLSADALLSFRDLAAISVIPYSRSLNTVYRTTNRIVYSNSFALYPWMLSNSNDTLIASTPAFMGFHDVKQFRGQSSPELPVMRIEESDVDTRMLDVLVSRWKRHYFGRRRRWKDRALFRSLNMAVQAGLIPANAPTIFDLGRSISLWVSAFEILSHPRIERADLFTVYRLFEGVGYYDRKVNRRQYAAYIPEREKAKRKKAGLKPVRYRLPCWIYGKLYQARNHFLHGNPIPKKALSPKGTKNGLFWLAPSLYRLALTGFLDLSVDPSVWKKLPYRFSDGALANPKFRKIYRAHDFQEMSERALLRILK